MRRKILWAVLLLPLAACGSLQEDYVKADRATYEALAPEYSRLVEATDTLTPEQKERRMALLASWRVRLEEAEKVAK